MARRDNPDRILESIDRARAREAPPPSSGSDRQATGRALDTDIPSTDATTTERLRRLFRIVEESYRDAASAEQLSPLAARFQAIGDLPDHRARGDVSVAVQYIDSDRYDDVGVVPFAVSPEDLRERRKETGTSRPDVNALRVLRDELRTGVVSSFQKIEPRLREAIRERADLGHVAVQVTLDVRPRE